MPKHNKDRQYITATEWKTEYGGKKAASKTFSKPLPFDCCAMSLRPFETPVCTRDGVVFDILEVMPYVRKQKRNPVDGTPLAPKDLVRLNFAKNGDGKWHCPVTFKTFNDHSRIVAIAKSGNVYAAEAVEELNVKARNWTDLLTGEEFERGDIIKISDPTDAALVARRDIANFVHLKEARDAASSAADAAPAASHIRRTPVTQQIFDAIAEKRQRDASAAAAAAEAAAAAAAELDAKLAAEGAPLWKRQRMLLDDLVDGRAVTTNEASGAFTSSAAGIVTGNTAREATDAEVNEARWTRLRRLKKKAYAQLQTSHGNVNLELHCDITPRTAENFIGLCNKGYYNGTQFHRSIRNFMAQGGDPTGTGRGGESIYGGKFADEFDNRLSHSQRGVLSMANAGRDTNGSQFFLTYKSCAHLDNQHTIFGRVVGGLNALAAIEAVPCDGKDRPKTDIVIHNAVVFVNPIEDMEQLFEQELAGKIAAREARSKARHAASGGRGDGGEGAAAQAAAAAEDRISWSSNPTPIAVEGDSVGRYLKAAAPTTLPQHAVGAGTGGGASSGGGAAARGGGAAGRGCSAAGAAAAAGKRGGAALDFREEDAASRKRKAGGAQFDFSGW